jgi:hypothetical protein
MTKITRQVVRETDVREHGDTIVAEMHPKYVALRFKGKPGTRLTVGYDVILGLARKLQYRREHGGRI